VSIFISNAVPGSRHSCEQGDQLDGYEWTEYDTRQGGVQVLKDSANNVKITTEFLKVQGGDHGGSWAARIKGEPMAAGALVLCPTWLWLTESYCA
jgi:mannosyl-oligosaccharide glucosidase